MRPSALLPAAAIGASTVATMMATVDSGPTLSSRLLPHSQQRSSAPSAPYRPIIAGTPASEA